MGSLIKHLVNKLNDFNRSENNEWCPSEYSWTYDVTVIDYRKRVLPYEIVL